MASTLSNNAAHGQAEAVNPPDEEQGDSLSPMLALLRHAIDECGWKHEAIAASIGVGGRYLSRMLDGEKPWTVRHLLQLPRDVEARFVQLYAERLGWIVVAPVDDATAHVHLAIGLFQKVLPRLP